MAFKWDSIPSWLKNGGIGIALAAVLTFLIDYQREVRVNCQFLLEQQQESIEDLRNEIEKLKLENQDFRVRYLTLSSIQDENPLPFVLQDVQGKAILVNKAFERRFLLPLGLTSNDYIGKTDMGFWGEMKGNLENARRFRKNSIDILDTGRIKRFDEELNLGGVNMKLITYRYPHWSSSIDFSGRVIIGTAAVVIPVDEIKNIIDKNK